MVAIKSRRKLKNTLHDRITPVNDSKIGSKEYQLLQSNQGGQISLSYKTNIWVFLIGLISCFVTYHVLFSEKVKRRNHSKGYSDHPLVEHDQL